MKQRVNREEMLIFLNIYIYARTCAKYHACIMVAAQIIVIDKIVFFINCVELMNLPAKIVKTI